MEEAWELAALAEVSLFSMSNARTLYNLSSELKVYGETYTGRAAITVLKEFSLQLGYSGTVSDFVSLYCKLIDAVADEILASPNLIKRSDIILSKLSKPRRLVEVAITQSTWGPVHNDFFTSDYLDILELIADTVEASGKVETFDPEKYETYKAELQELHDEILSSDLELSVKAPILGQLKKLIKVFENYSIFGATDADLRIKSILGDIIINGETISNSSPEAKAAVLSLLNYVRKHYPGFKWTVDHLMTAANVGLLAVQSGAI